MDEFADIFPGYRILAKLGEGTTGIVYKVRDTRLNRVAAIKTLADPEIANSVRRTRLIREAQVLASFDGEPGGAIPTLQMVAEHNGRPYYHREFVEGETLEHLVGSKSIQLKDALRILVSVAQTVQWVHERQLVHCNLHPSNILVAIDHSAKLIGFGHVAHIDELAVIPAGQPRDSIDIDVQALQKTLDWLCFFLRQPVPPSIEALRYGQLPSTAAAFAELLAKGAHELGL
jgi:serine/threonine protein kinase